MSWNGCKVYIDTNDIGLPTSAFGTSALLHYGQVAIQLILKSVCAVCIRMGEMT